MFSATGGALWKPNALWWYEVKTKPPKEGGDAHWSQPSDLENLASFFGSCSCWHFLKGFCSWEFFEEEGRRGDADCTQGATFPTCSPGREKVRRYIPYLIFVIFDTSNIFQLKIWHQKNALCRYICPLCCCRKERWYLAQLLLDPVNWDTSTLQSMVK